MPIRGEATATLHDGRRLTLKINFATLARVADAVGKPAKEVFAIIDSEDHPSQMLVGLKVIECALHRHHPEIDEDALGDLMLDEVDAAAITAANRAAMIGAFGDAEGKEGENPPTPAGRGGTSTRSSASGRKPGKTPRSSGSKRPAAS